MSCFPEPLPSWWLPYTLLSFVTGKYSKDRTVAIFLNKRIYVDEGDGTEPISGIVRVKPERASSLPSGKGTWEFFARSVLNMSMNVVVGDAVSHTSLSLLPQAYLLQ
jgi:hypothetical protein